MFSKSINQSKLVIFLRVAQLLVLGPTFGTKQYQLNYFFFFFNNFPDISETKQLID